MSDSLGPLYTIDGGNNADSGWLDISWLTADISFSIYGTFVGTVALDVSDDPALPKNNYRTPKTYTTGQDPLGIPRNIGSFIRFRRQSWVSGVALIGLSNGINSNGQVKPVSVQSQSYNGG